MDSRDLVICALLIGAFAALTVITPTFIPGYMTIDFLSIVQSVILTAFFITGIEALGLGCITGIIAFILSRTPSTAPANIPAYIASAMIMWIFIQRTPQFKGKPGIVGFILLWVSGLVFLATAITFSKLPLYVVPTALLMIVLPSAILAGVITQILCPLITRRMKK